MIGVFQKQPWKGLRGYMQYCDAALQKQRARITLDIKTAR